MTAIKLFDLTKINVPREMYRSEDDPLAEPTFRRHVDRVTTEEELERAADRLRRVRRVA